MKRSLFCRTEQLLVVVSSLLFFANAANADVASRGYVDMIVNAVSLTPGPAGPQGIQGEPGPQGEPGSVAAVVNGDEEGGKYIASITLDPNTKVLTVVKAYDKDTDTNTMYGIATTDSMGLVRMGSGVSQSVAPNAVSTAAGRSYSVQNDSNGRMVVNVPWVDTDTIITHTSQLTNDSGYLNKATADTYYDAAGSAAAVRSKIRNGDNLVDMWVE